jgi:hypothetical protein
VENKICHNCWYCIPNSTTAKKLDDPESVENIPYCELNSDFPPVKSDHTCENWESKKLNFINVIKTLYGL